MDNNSKLIKKMLYLSNYDFNKSSFMNENVDDSFTIDDVETGISNLGKLNKEMFNNYRRQFKIGDVESAWDSFIEEKREDEYIFNFKIYNDNKLIKYINGERFKITVDSEKISLMVFDLSSTKLNMYKYVLSIENNIGVKSEKEFISYINKRLDDEKEGVIKDENELENVNLSGADYDGLNRLLKRDKKYDISFSDKIVLAEKYTKIRTLEGYITNFKYKVMIGKVQSNEAIGYLGKYDIKEKEGDFYVKQLTISQIYYSIDTNNQYILFHNVDNKNNPIISIYTDSKILKKDLKVGYEITNIKKYIDLNIASEVNKREPFDYEELNRLNTKEETVALRFKLETSIRSN